MAYVSSTKDTDVFEKVYWLGKEIAFAMEENDLDWGAWVYDDMAVAMHEDYDGATRYFEMSLSGDDDVIQTILRDISRKMTEYERCSHVHDCCGCSFFSGLRGTRLYPTGDTYILKETWGRNV